MIRFVAVVLTTNFILSGQQRLSAQSPQPKVTVKSVRLLFDNGEHNAFTDFVRYQDNYYVTFRSCPDGHGVHPTASVIVLTSKDAKSWKQVHRFRVAKRDTRDPHFLIFQKKLFVYTGTWYCGDRSPPREQWDLNRHLGYAAWTADGKKWHSPIMLEGTYGHYIWRAATHNGKAYLCGRRRKEFTTNTARDFIESAMLESDDGLVWRTATLFQETFGDETSFLFDKKGNILAVSRRGSGKAQLCRSSPPYEKWQRSDLSQYIGGPLLAQWGKRYLVGGRKNTKNGPKTALYWLVEGKLHQFAELPSGGDNSYPAFVELSPTRGLLTYYSSHEMDEKGRRRTAIYLAELEVEK